MLTLIQTGKSPLVPVVLLDEPGGTYWKDALRFMRGQLEENRYILPSDMRLMRLVDDANEAAKEIANFYRNFHSSRWLKDRFVLRLNHKLNEQAMEYLNEEFVDLCLTGSFEQQSCCESELDEPELQRLPRLSFVFNGRNHGRLRELTDYVNEPANWVRPLDNED